MSRLHHLPKALICVPRFAGAPSQLYGSIGTAGTLWRPEARASWRVAVKSALSTSATTRLAAPEMMVSSVAQCASLVFRARTINRNSVELPARVALAISPLSRAIVACCTNIRTPRVAVRIAASRKPVPVRFVFRTYGGNCGASRLYPPGDLLMRPYLSDRYPVRLLCLPKER